MQLTNSLSQPLAYPLEIIQSTLRSKTKGNKFAQNGSKEAIDMNVRATNIKRYMTS